MELFRISNVSIPADWTVEQTEAVVRFLEEICLAIWDQHYEKLVEADNRRFDKLSRVVDTDPEIPF